MSFSERDFITNLFWTWFWDRFFRGFFFFSSRFRLKWKPSKRTWINTSSHEQTEKSHKTRKRTNENVHNVTYKSKEKKKKKRGVNQDHSQTCSPRWISLYKQLWERNFVNFSCIPTICITMRYDAMNCIRKSKRR